MTLATLLVFGIANDTAMFFSQSNGTDMAVLCTGIANNPNYLSGILGCPYKSNIRSMSTTNFSTGYSPSLTPERCLSLDQLQS